jgi:hypothetical protein
MAKERIECVETNDGRALVVDGARQSLLMPDDIPITGEAWDMLALGYYACLCPPPSSILFLGVAGGTAPRIIRWLAKKDSPHKKCFFDGVDCDMEMMAKAQDFMKLGECGWRCLEVRFADEFIDAHKDARWEMVVEDMFVSRKKPAWLRDDPVGPMRLVDKYGVYVANMHRDDTVWYRPAIRRRFVNVIELRARHLLNRVVIASNQLQFNAIAFRNAIDWHSFRAIRRRLRVRTIQEDKALGGMW